MSDLGYVEGQNLILNVNWGNGTNERLAELATTVVRARPDVIVTQGGAARAVKNAGADMPVVFGYSGDPIEAGFAQSLSHPGRNMTGVTFLSLELVGKRMQMLKEAIPKMKRVAILANPDHFGEQSERRVSQTAASALALEYVYFQAQKPTELEPAMAAAAISRSEGLVVFPEALTVSYRQQIADSAMKYRIAAISGWAQFAESGCLLSYGPNLRESYRRLATYVDKILKGAKASELPVELPTRVETVVNLRTAKALGLTIPPSILLRADKVIE